MGWSLNVKSVNICVKALQFVCMVSEWRWVDGIDCFMALC